MLLSKLFKFQSSLLAVALLANTVPSLAKAESPDPDATNDEIALMVITNQFRSNPAYLGVTDHGPTRNLMWNKQLAAAARFHMTDVLTTPCAADHNSCNGESTETRLKRYYPLPLGGKLGENMAYNLLDPRAIVTGWLGDYAHRDNLLSDDFDDVGTALRFGQAAGDNTGSWWHATLDVGAKSLFFHPEDTGVTLPAGAVLPRLATNGPREFIVNYNDPHGGTPRSVNAMFGDSCFSLSPTFNAPANVATYATTRSFSGNGCVPLVFEAIKSDGTRVLYPDNGSILVGVGSSAALCAERSYPIVPTANCGNGTVPPGVAPTLPPPSEKALKVISSNVTNKEGANAIFTTTIEAKEGTKLMKGVRIQLVATSSSGKKYTRSATTQPNGRVNLSLSVNRNTAFGSYRAMATGKLNKKSFAQAAMDFTVTKK